MKNELEPVRIDLRTRTALAIEGWIDRANQEPPQTKRSLLKNAARLTTVAGLVVGGAIGADHVSGLHLLPGLTNKIVRSGEQLPGIDRNEVILIDNTSTSLDKKYYIFNAHPGLTLRISPKAIGVLAGNSRVGINLPGREVGVAVFAPTFIDRVQEEASRLELSRRVINPLMTQHHGAIDIRPVSIYAGLFLKDLQRKGIDPLQNLEKLSLNLSLTWVERLRERAAQFKGERFTPLTPEIESIVKNNLPITVEAISPEALAWELGIEPKVIPEGMETLLGSNNRSATFPNGIVANYIEAKIIARPGELQKFLRDPQFGINAPEDFVGISLIIPGNQRSDAARKYTDEFTDLVEPNLMSQYVREQKRVEGIQTRNFFYITNLIHATLDKNPQLDPYSPAFIRALGEELSAGWYRATLLAVNGIRKNSPALPFEETLQQAAKNRRLFEFLDIDKKLIDEAVKERPTEAGQFIPTAEVAPQSTFAYLDDVFFNATSGLNLMIKLDPRLRTPSSQQKTIHVFLPGLINSDEFKKAREKFDRDTLPDITKNYLPNNTDKPDVNYIAVYQLIQNTLVDPTTGKIDLDRIKHADLVATTAYAFGKPITNPERQKILDRTPVGVKYSKQLILEATRNLP